MSVLRALVARIGGLFGRSSADRDLADEFAVHLDMATAEYARRGLAPAEATRRARLDAGNLSASAEAYRDQRGLPRIVSLLRSVRLATRTLTRSPGFATLAVLTLALGIGLATAVYTVADAMALRRLPVRDQGRIVVLWGRSRDGRFDNYPVAGAEDFVRASRVLRPAAYFAWFGSAPTAVRDGATVSRLNRALVSGGFFGVLGTKVALGRALRPGDDAVGAGPRTVISYRVWQQRYGGAPDVLGRRISLYDDIHTYTIVGVMPQGFDYPGGTDFWAPLAVSLPPSVAPLIGFDILGRLAHGATPTDAADELSAYLTRPQSSVWQRDLRGVAHTLPDLVLGNTRPALIAFAAAAALLLLITCVNVATLLLVRGLGRMREVAIRLALGAGRAVVTGQLLIENGLLAIAGGVLGIAVAWGAVHVFVAIAPPNTPRLDEIGLNRAAFVAAFAIAAAAVLLFGLAPAVITARVDPQESLRSGTRQSASRQSRLGAEALVAVQIALALIVLSAAASIGRTLVNLERAPLGFEAKHLLIGDLALRGDQDPATTDAILEMLMQRIAAIPGVTAASPVVATPFAGAAGWSGRPAAAGQSPAEAAANPILNFDLVEPGYFAAIGMPILRGRGFTDDDRAGAPGAVVVSEAAARYYWPNADPIGQRLSMGAKLDDTFTVVGVVPDSRYRDYRNPMPSVYFALRQSIFPPAPTSLVVRTNGRAGDLVGTLRRTIATDAPGMSLASIAPFDTYLAGPLGQPRLNAFLLAVFAAAAVGLSALGLFGVTSAMVRRRTREIGIRTALGATTRDLTGMVLKRGLAISAAGIAVGAAGALGTSRLLQGLLYGTSPSDPVLLSAACAGLLGMTVLATIVPAWRAARVDPVKVLRAE